MDEKIPSQIAFEFKISPEYKVYAVSGCHGGLNAYGDVIMNLFCERGPIPRLQTFEILDGRLGEKPIKEEKKDSVIRDVMFGVSMNPNVARSVGEWLQKMADQYEELLAEKNSGDDQ